MAYILYAVCDNPKCRRPFAKGPFDGNPPDFSSGRHIPVLTCPHCGQQRAQDPREVQAVVLQPPG